MIPGLALGQGQDGAPGITMRTIFRAFDAAAPACSPPVGLRPMLTYVQENDREFLQGIDHGLSMAAKDRGLEYNRVIVENDVAKGMRLISNSLREERSTT